MIAAVAASTNTDPAMAALCALGVSSACAVGRWRVELTSDWIEPGWLYLAVIAPPTAGKSPVFGHMVRPLVTIFDQERRARAQANAGQRAVRDMLDESLTRAKKKGDRAEAQRLAEEIAALPPLDDGCRYFTGDVTPESLARLMAGNGGRLAQLDDEGQLLDMVSGRFSDLPDLSPWLKGYNGDQSLQIARRDGLVSADNAALSVLTLTQPSVLDQVLEKGRLTGKGFLQRFLFVNAAPAADFLDNPPAIPRQVKEDYEDDLHRMAGAGNRTLSLTPEAAPLWTSWRRTHFDNVRGVWKSLAEFKLSTLPARLAVNLALWQGDVFSIGAEVMAQAIDMAGWFIAHLLAIFGDENSLTPEGASALDAVKGKASATVSDREIKHALRRRTIFRGKSASAQEEALRELCDLGFMRVSLAPPGGGKWYEVNPTLLKDGDTIAS